MLIIIGDCVRFGQVQRAGVMAGCRPRNGVLTQTCGLTCGGSVTNLLMMNWSFSYV